MEDDKCLTQSCDSRKPEKDEYHIIKPDKPYRAILKEKISTADCRIRKDSVLMIETMLTASPEFMKNLPAEDQRKFFRLATQFFEKEIGRKNIISAVVHLDEKTPHMHLCFVPLTPDGHLSAQISSASISIAHWKREAAEATRSSRESSEQMGKMKTEVMSLYSQVSDLQRYVKHMPPEMKQKHEEARQKSLRMLRGDYER